MPPKPLCTFFLRGQCTNDNCRFSHDTAGAQPQNVCRWFLAGNCRFGKGCRYDHVKPKSSTVQRTDSRPKTGGPGQPGTQTQPSAQPGPTPAAAVPFVPGQQWGGGGGSSSSSGSRGGDGGAAATGSWAGVASLNAPRSEPHGHLEPTDEELSWLDQEIMAAYIGDGGEPFSPNRGGSGSSDPGLTEEEYWLLERELALADAEFEQADSLADVVPAAAPNDGPAPATPLEDQLSADELAWLAQVTGEGEREKDHPDAIPPGPDPSEPAAALLPAPPNDTAGRIQASADVECSICIETVLDKFPHKSRRFALLTGCDHAFCVDCMQKWRGSADAKTSMVRECPTCRITSHFFVPSPHFATGAEKEKVIAQYKARCAQTHCHHFQRGEATCPFGSSCFYRHELPDGTEAKERPRYIATADGDAAPMQNIRMSDFLDARQAAASAATPDGTPSKGPG